MAEERPFGYSLNRRLQTEEDAVLESIPTIDASEDFAVKTRKIGDFLRAMVVHFDEEETTIFRRWDALKTKPPDVAAVVARLRAEHVRMKEMTASMLAALPGSGHPLDSGNLAELAKTYLAYSDLLLRHARYEDERLFPRLERLFQDPSA